VPSWVCSPDGLVSDHRLDIIQGNINFIYAGEDPYSKVYCAATHQNVSIELLAVVIDEVDGPGDAYQRVAAFTRGIHNRFGVGSMECGSGAVLVISVSDRQVRLTRFPAQLDEASMFQRATCFSSSFLVRTTSAELP
jgi:hypothetical protein